LKNNYLRTPKRRRFFEKKKEKRSETAERR